MGSELYAFQSCGLPALTWVDLQGGEPGLEKLAATHNCAGDAGPCPTTVQFTYVELDAEVSGPCRCGHSGLFQRELSIKELLIASRDAPADCPQTEPAYPHP